MNNYEEKLKEEKKLLDKKIKNLQQFIESNPIFDTLNEYEKQDMSKQLQVMNLYTSILKSRINRFI